MHNFKSCSIFTIYVIEFQLINNVAFIVYFLQYTGWILQLPTEIAMPLFYYCLFYCHCLLNLCSLLFIYIFSASIYDLIILYIYFISTY